MDEHYANTGTPGGAAAQARASSARASLIRKWSFQQAIQPANDEAQNALEAAAANNHLHGPWNTLSASNVRHFDFGAAGGFFGAYLRVAVCAPCPDAAQGGRDFGVIGPVPEQGAEVKAVVSE